MTEPGFRIVTPPADAPKIVVDRVVTGVDPGYVPAGQSRCVLCVHPVHLNADAFTLISAGSVVPACVPCMAAAIAADPDARMIGDAATYRGPVL